MIGYGMEKKKGVISGGTSGIGLAAARLLVQDGATVWLVGRDPERGQKAVDLAYFEELPDKRTALQREYALKQLAKKQKEELVRQFSRKSLKIP